jgi:hypothetical protein
MPRTTRIFRFGLSSCVAAAFALLSASGDVSEAQAAGKKGYLMKCQAGSGMRVTVTQGMLNFSFRRSAGGATKVPLKAGECAWMSRAVSSSEPKVLSLPLTGLSLNSMQTSTTGKLMSLSFQETVGSGKVSTHSSSSVNKMLKNFFGKREFYVRAYRASDPARNGNRFFVSGFGVDS